MSNPYPQHNKPELLSPAGDMECFFAAVENGADAVYFGLKDFSARASANNFAIDDASKVIAYARKRSVKVYIAINTLIKTQELESVVDYLIALDELQPDALIIQDLGLLYLIQSQFPDFRIHASTQMTIHNLAGVKRLERMGFKRVVLSRELSIDEIKNISRNTSMEIEVFVHGALCYSYSGLCFFSSMMGGRSGNRGRCAQPCRMYYKSQPDEGGYLFSMKDLRTLSYIKELMTAGIHSFKIEGRMKSPEYVAVVTHIYRQAIDGKLKDEEAAIHLMNTVFSRQAASSYLIKENGQRNSKTANVGAVKPSDMINPLYPASIGSYAGEVIKSGKGCVTIRADADIGVRDLLQVFKNSSEEPALLHVKNIKVDGKRVFGIKAGDIAIVDTERQYKQGAKIYLLSSQKVKENFAPKVPKKLDASKIPVDVEIKIRPDSIGIRGTAKHFSFSRDFSVKLEKGINRTTEMENIKECFARLGNTPFELAGIHAELSGELFVPLSVLNEIRRDYFQIFCEEWRRDSERRSENIKKWIQEKFIEYSSSDNKLSGESSISTSVNPPLEKGVTVHSHLNLIPSPFPPLSEGDRGRKLRDNEYSPPLVGGVRGGG
ncbi:MAG TPA: peptidase U32 family protein, partial [Candidatus Wunengus sp. YC61]|uniref:peptidase U32 family protein n=1 Tax=Candidatus Wunengus sp. YC61 TaxID=3367698 RepID=UPI004026F2CB